MIRFLQRQKAKKGFTIIELIVVIAILAVLMAVILPQLSTQRSRISEAKAAASDFYAAIQTTMNYYSVYDGQLLSDDTVTNETDVMRYYKLLGGNYPFNADEHSDHAIDDMGYPDNISMYIMVYAKNDIIQETNIVTRLSNKNSGSENGMFQLLKRGKKDDGSDDGSSAHEFIRILQGEIDDRVTFNDGYYYAKVVFNFDGSLDLEGNPIDINLYTIKVEYTAYCRKQLPNAAGTTYDTFSKSITFGNKDYILNWNGGEVCGTCAAWDTTNNNCIGLAGTTLT